MLEVNFRKTFRRHEQLSEFVVYISCDTDYLNWWSKEKDKKLADDGDFKLSDEMVTLIDIDFEIYEKKLSRIEDK